MFARINEAILVRIAGAQEEGQAMAEYGLILALIAVIAIGALTAIGSGVSTNFNAVASKL